MTQNSRPPLRPLGMLFAFALNLFFVSVVYISGGNWGWSSSLLVAAVLIAAAAVTDWRPDQRATQKVKKEDAASVPTLRLVQNPDILATLAQSPRGQSQALFCVGFAAESEDLLNNATRKRLRKDVPLLVGNIGPAVVGQAQAALTLFDGEQALPLALADKSEQAAALVLQVAQRLRVREHIA